MTDRPKSAAEPQVSLGSLAEQLERVLDRLDAIEGQMAVMTGMMIRREGLTTAALPSGS